MDPGYLKNVVEATLLAAGRPLDVGSIAELFEEFERPETDEVREAIAALGRDCEGRSIELVEVASGFRLQVRSDFATPVSRLWQERPTKYSRALLETLALIAYRQPITRGEIEEVRGVAVNPNIIKTLSERGWVRVVGTREVPGRPELFGTTREFLDYFGLKSLDVLPTLAELKDMDNIGVQLEFPEGQKPAAGVAADGVAPTLTVVEGGLAGAAIAAEGAAQQPAAEMGESAGVDAATADESAAPEATTASGEPTAEAGAGGAH